jgi:hypothetical protein
MFRQYLFVFSTYFLLCSGAVAASEWDQAKHNIRTSLEVVHNSNLYNQADIKSNDQSAAAVLQYDWLGLFEGYGLALPATIKSRHYLEYSALNASDYQFAPALKMFLSDAIDLTLHTQWQRELLLAGSGNAEFLPAELQSLTAEQKLFQLSLQLGREPDKQNLVLHLGRDLNDHESQGQMITELEADFIKADYGHRLNENTSLLLHAEARREHQWQTASELQQLGAGWSSHWGGSQLFRLVLGQFWRDTETENSSGSFWQAENLWQLSQQWQLQFISHRNSVLSYATDSVSQLDTLYSAKLGYLWTDAHSFALIAGRRLSAFEQQQLQRRRLELALDWQWQLSSAWQQQLRLQRSTQRDNGAAQKVRTEVFWQVSWLW